MSLGKLLALALSAAALGVASAADAQDMPTILPNDYVLKDILNQQRIESSIGAPLGGRPARAPSPSSRTARPAATSTTYRADPAVSQKVRRQFADWMGRRTSPEDGRRVAQLLERNDPVANWAQEVGDDGLRPGDAADALAAYWLLNWAIANRGDGSRAQILAVRDQVRTMMTDNPGFARMDEPGRQAFAETLMLNFLVQKAAYADAVRRGDQATLKRLGDAAVARFRSEMGVDLRRLRLTARGFVLA